jgi:Rieske Fe-S protein
VLLGSGLLGWLGSILYPVFSFLKPPEIPEANVSSISAGPAADLVAGSGKIVKFGRTPVLVLRTDGGEIRAFQATCTHLDCIVQYRDDLKRIWCACHNGNYDLQGRVISGPPPKPLTAFQVQLVNDEIMISKPEQIV